MIKFFRTLRQKLLEGHNFSRYLLYAVGEIALVMIGILLALQVNNWNEQQKNNKIELETLGSFREDLVSSQSQLTQKLESTQERVLFDSLVLLHISERQPGIDKDSFNFLVTEHFSPPTFDPEEGMLNEIISTGKLNIIKSMEIRSFITSWNMNMEEIKELEKALLDNFTYQKEPYFYNHFAYRDNVRAIGQSNLNWDIGSVLTDIRFENIMVKSLAIHRTLQGRQKTFRNQMQEIIAIIDAEIKVLRDD